MEISTAGVELIVGFEGKGSREGRLPNGNYKPYLDKIAVPHVWTLYAGLTKNVEANRTYTEAECEAMFQKELAVYENDILTSVHVPLNQNEFDACVSFTYNCGGGAFKKSIAPLLNAGKRSAVPAKMGEYRNAGGKVISGLVRRRKAEGALFLKPVDEPAPAEDTEPEPMPQAPERAIVPVTKAVAVAATESRTFWAAMSGIGAYLITFWQWLTGTAAQVSTEARTAKESLSAWDALWSFVGLNTGTIMAMIVIGALCVVLVRTITTRR